MGQQRESTLLPLFADEIRARESAAVRPFFFRCVYR